jgi:hypothetical protein
MTPAERNALADRIEAEAPSRELDAAIYNAVPDGPNRKAERLPVDRWESRFDDGWRTMWADREDKYCEPLKRYTTSLDAAMTLVPEGWFVDISIRPERFKPSAAYTHPSKVRRGLWYRVEASTRPQAVCAAALRAQAQEAGDAA